MARSCRSIGEAAAATDPDHALERPADTTSSIPVTLVRSSRRSIRETTQSFRTNAYPAMAIDDAGRVYVAWAQRGVGPSGDTRIVISTSVDGRKWSTAVAVDNHSARGHQFMPVAQLRRRPGCTLVFWDQRDDKSEEVLYTFIDEAPILAPTARGTPPCVRSATRSTQCAGAASNPGAPPVGPSVKTLRETLEGTRNGSTTIEQMQFNPPELAFVFSRARRRSSATISRSQRRAELRHGTPTARGGSTPRRPTRRSITPTWPDNRDVRGARRRRLGQLHGADLPRQRCGAESTFDLNITLEKCTAGQADAISKHLYSSRVAT